MARNTGNGSRKGSVTDRVQSYNPQNKSWVKVDTNTGRIIDSKQGDPYKGVAKTTDDRRE